LAPLFYRLAPLDDATLRDRLLRMAEKAGVPVLGVWVADQSRKSRTANAAVVGLGSTRRIILFDTLIREFTPDEVEAVLAHELAHHVHRDVARGLLVQSAVTLATFWAADQILDVGSRWLGLHGPADLGGLPLFGLVLMALGLVALPLANGWSRHVERQADDFALRTAGDPEAFIGAMDRLGDLNLAERDPHYVKEFLLYSHPSVARRIARARAVIHSSHCHCAATVENADRSVRARRKASFSHTRPLCSTLSGTRLAQTKTRCPAPVRACRTRWPRRCTTSKFCAR